MDADYAQRYRRLYEQHWWWRAREQFVLRHLERIVPAEGVGCVLDVGCGDGLFLPELKRFGTAEGLEADADIVTDRGRANGKIYVQPFDDHFQPGQRYGLIVMLDVLEHIEDDAAALSHVHDLLESGAPLLLTVPASRRLWTGHDDLNHHCRRYGRRQLVQRLEAAGLQVESCSHFFHWLVPLKLLVKAKESLSSAPPAPAEVPPAALNALFLALSRLEQQTLGRLPWPFGTSLIAVARRTE